MHIKWLQKNITAKILSFLFAFIMWFYVTINAVFTTKVTLPIQYIGKVTFVVNTALMVT